VFGADGASAIALIAEPLFPMFAPMSRQPLPLKSGSELLGSPPVLVSKRLCSPISSRCGLFGSITMEPFPGNDA
jgi:hypothetical protein